MICPTCGTELGPARLSCPSCHALVHADRLRTLAAEAERLATAGQISEALASWRTALELLPPEAGQVKQIEARIEELSRRPIPPGGNRPRTPGLFGRTWKGGGLLGLVALALSQGKLLLFGLANAGTLFSMLLSLGVYWNIFGWRLAALFLLSIYVHEMGHVAALRQIGLKASAPMFIPGLGALIRLRQHPTNPREDALVGLAGPIWGTGAAIVAYAGARAFHSPLLATTALLGAWINLFNLVPLWQLDGGRAFRALNRWQRGGAAVVLFAAGWATGDMLAYALGAVAAYRAIRADGPPEGDRTTFVKYIGLVAALAMLWLAAAPLTKGSGGL